MDICEENEAEAAAKAETEAEAEDDEWSSYAEEVCWTDDVMYNFFEATCTLDGMVRFREKLNKQWEDRSHPDHGKPLHVLIPTT